MTNRQKMNLPMPLATLATHCKGEIIGDGKCLVEHFCSVSQPRQKGLMFVGSSAAAKHIQDDPELLYIVTPQWREAVRNGICHEQPQQAFRLILSALLSAEKATSAKIADTAVISPTAIIGQGVNIGEYSVIGDKVIIGDQVAIGCGCVIEAHATIGSETQIEHRVVIHRDVDIGEACVIAGGAVIGGQGFGFSFEGGNWEAVPQIGGVRIGKRVHIGANTCIDCGAIDDTVIGDNVIIDNLVHIAHNVRVGTGTAMAAGVGIAGSTTVGKYGLLAGQVGVVGHIDIADNVQVNGGARVLQSIHESGTYAGSFHVQPVRKWNKITVYLKKLETLFKREKQSD